MVKKGLEIVNVVCELPPKVNEKSMRWQHADDKKVRFLVLHIPYKFRFSLLVLIYMSKNRNVM